MLFNSIQFVIFLPVVFGLYWFVFNRKVVYQNLFCIAASYFFYGWWDWRFLLLLMFSSGLDYSVGVMLGSQQRPAARKLILLLSIIVNLSLLGFFKYYNFFAENAAVVLQQLGMQPHLQLLHVVLPVGISFYTFQSLSYAIDVYKRRMEPTRDVISFLAYVSFFPQLVAGPIERAIRLLPQFQAPRVFSYEEATNGMRQILWGLFKKVVIADNCATIVNKVFGDYEHYSGITLAVSAVLFAFQIYGDFSGYSDIAIGTARLFGIKLMRNFNYPYFSRDIAEFWRRWHISLSTWFRDYVYFPLGGSKGGTWQKVRNTFIIFLLSGFWHGANWTFIVWGGLNAFYFLPLLLSGKNREHLGTPAEGRLLPRPAEALQILGTFLLVTFAWIFFRADSMHTAIGFITRIFTSPVDGMHLRVPVEYVLFILLMLSFEWLQREKEYPLESWSWYSKPGARWVMYFGFALLVGLYFGGNSSFIYFQF